MGLQKGGSAPKPPNPSSVAAAQAAANKETAITQARLNQINQYTPYGNLEYSPTGQTADGVQLYKSTMTLSPQQQALFDQQQALTGQIMDAAGPQISKITDILATPFNYDGLPDAPVANDETLRRTEDALYNRAAQYLDPMWQQRDRDLRTQLLNSGIVQGSDAYNEAIQNQALSRRGDYSDAIWRAIGAGGQEQSRLFGLEDTARKRAIEERAFLRNQPINEFAAVLGQSPGVGIPQFSQAPATSVASTDITGPTYDSYNAQANNYYNQQRANNSFFGSLANLGGTLGSAWIGMSDPDVKEDVKPVKSMADALRGVPVKKFKYKGSDRQRVGVMADEWAEKFGGDGSTIDGMNAFGLTLAAIQELAQRMDRVEGRRA